MTGVQTPLQSGSLLSACQSWALGGGLIAPLSAALAGNDASRAQAIRLKATMMRLMRFNMGHEDNRIAPRLPNICCTGPLFEAPARYSKDANSSFELHA